MTAPRPREHNRPPSPPDRLPPRPGGSPSGLLYRFAAGRARPSGRGAFRRSAAAVLLVVLAAGVAFAPAAHAQDVTALQATMTVGSQDISQHGGFVTRHTGYLEGTAGVLST